MTTAPATLPHDPAKVILSSVPTPSLRWMGRGESRVLQQCFAVTTVDTKTGHQDGHFEWIEVPTFVEDTLQQKAKPNDA